MRSKLWYVASGVIFAGLLAYSILTQAWTFTAVLILCVSAYGYAHRKAPPHRKISLSENGIVWGDTFISWKKCAGFWLLQGPGYVELHIDVKEPRQRHLTIQTGTVNPSDIHALCARHIPFYPERQEKILDAIIRLCKI
ncbi:MAG: hypothetical protein PHE68_03000 [Candidatus Peribacteraceae bacterium]|nr:hypothetical protein [Candidatus Peribacteraceae bacterium]MDD5074264.1 hypothetical protein [Candidatus Peribacteraceae bacterium]